MIFFEDEDGFGIRLYKDPKVYKTLRWVTAAAFWDCKQYKDSLNFNWRTTVTLELVGIR